VTDETENHDDSIPYFHNGIRELAEQFSNYAHTMLNAYGSYVEVDGTLLDTAEWADNEIMSSYKLARYNILATIEPNLEGFIQFSINSTYPDGQNSLVAYVHIKGQFGLTKHYLKMTEEQEEAHRKKFEGVEVQADGHTKAFVTVNHEHDLEIDLLLSVLERGNELLAAEFLAP